MAPQPAGERGVQIRMPAYIELSCATIFRALFILLLSLHVSYTMFGHRSDSTPTQASKFVESSAPELVRRPFDSNAPELSYHGSYAPEVHQPGLEPHLSSVYPDASIKPKEAQFYSESSASEQRLCGLRPATFFLSLALLIVILAAAIGGGVGGSMAAHNKQKLADAHSTIARLQAQATPASATPTNSDGSATVTKTAFPSPSSDCLSLSNPNFTAPSGASYTRVCASSIDPSSTYEHYFNVVQYTFEDCITTCDTYNDWMSTRNVTVVHFNYAGNGQPPGECWCVAAVAMEYKAINWKGQDSAFLIGSYLPNALF